MEQIHNWWHVALLFQSINIIHTPITDIDSNLWDVYVNSHVKLCQIFINFIFVDFFDTRISLIFAVTGFLYRNITHYPAYIIQQPHLGLLIL